MVYVLGWKAAVLASARRLLNLRVQRRRVVLAVLAALPFNFVAPLVALAAVIAGGDPEDTGFGLLAALNIFFSALALMKYGVDLRDLAIATYESLRGLKPDHSAPPALYRI